MEYLFKLIFNLGKKRLIMINREQEINEFLNEYKTLWNKLPYLRFTQVLEYIKVESNLPDDTFYVTDEKFIKVLKEINSRLILN